MPAMQAPNWEQDFYINPSIGEDAIGAMLLQKGKGSHSMCPVYCASRVKLVAKRNVSNVDLVMASVVFAIIFYLGFCFFNKLHFFASTYQWYQHVSKTVMRWVVELQEFNFSFLIEEST